MQLRRSLGGLAITTAVVAVALVAPHAANADVVVTNPRPLATTFTLAADYAAYPAVPGTPADFDDMMAQASHERRALSACAGDALDPVEGDLIGFCFNAYDNDMADAFPQGITNTQQASAASKDGRGAVVVSWYHENAAGVADRTYLTAVDWQSDTANTYQKILLVKPRTGADGKVTYSPYTLHGNGMVWYGDYLYLSNNIGGDGQNGLEIFDMRRLRRVQLGSGIGLQSDGSYTAGNFQYILPSVGKVRQTSSQSRLTFNGVALNRGTGGPDIAVSEYNNDVYGGDTGRFTSFPLDPTTMKFPATVSSNAVYTYNIPHVQGVLLNGTRWWFGSSGSNGARGMRSWDGSGAFSNHEWVGVTQGLVYASLPDSADRIWTMRENQGSRTVFGFKQGLYH